MRPLKLSNSSTQHNRSATFNKTVSTLNTNPDSGNSCSLSFPVPFDISPPQEVQEHPSACFRNDATPRVCFSPVRYSSADLILRESLPSLLPRPPLAYDHNIPKNETKLIILHKSFIVSASPRLQACAMQVNARVAWALR